MNQVIQFIVGNSWILIPILIGVFNVGVRAQQKAKDQKAKRDAIAELNRRKSESMRTGKAVDEPIIVFDKEPAKASVTDDRKARIEALRKQRMEQLRAMREKRAGGAASTQAAPPSRKPAQSPARARVQPPAPGQAQARPVRGGTQPNVRAPQGSVKRPANVASKFTPVGQTRTQSASAQPVKPRGKKQKAAVAKQRSRVSSAGAGAVTEFEAPQQKKQPIAPDYRISSGAVGVKQMLHDRKRTRQAMVLQEVLASPVGLRPEGSGPGSMPF